MSVSYTHLDYDDDDYYWEYENAYVDGQKQSVFAVSYTHLDVYKRQPVWVTGN